MIGLGRCCESGSAKADAARQRPGSPPLRRRPIGVEALNLPSGLGHPGELHLLILSVQDAVVLHRPLGRSQVLIAALVPCSASERPTGTEHHSSTTALAQERRINDMDVASLGLLQSRACSMTAMLPAGGLVAAHCVADT